MQNLLIENQKNKVDQTWAAHTSMLPDLPFSCFCGRTCLTHLMVSVNVGAKVREALLKWEPGNLRLSSVSFYGGGISPSVIIM